MRLNGVFIVFHQDKNSTTINKIVAEICRSGRRGYVADVGHSPANDLFL